MGRVIPRFVHMLHDEPRPDIAERCGLTVARAISAPLDCGHQMGICITFHDGKRYAVRCASEEEGIAALLQYIAIPEEQRRRHRRPA